MKRNLLLKEIHKRGAVFVRHGKKHDIYENPKTGIIEQIPRHSDIEENLAKNIIKHFS
jgi:predicted RNA binding protein YcfA (HicA-like mRNA interferase family)